jgi:hypothetical protein
LSKVEEQKLLGGRFKYLELRGCVEGWKSERLAGPRWRWLPETQGQITRACYICHKC